MEIMCGLWTVHSPCTTFKESVNEIKKNLNSAFNFHCCGKY